MKCVINLSNEIEHFEIVTELNDEIVKELMSFVEEESISSEDLVHLLIHNFLEPECLY